MSTILKDILVQGHNDNDIFLLFVTIGYVIQFIFSKSI